MYMCMSSSSALHWDQDPPSSRPYCDVGRVSWASRPEQKPGAPGVGRRAVRHHRAMQQSAAVVRCKSSTWLQPSPPKVQSTRASGSPTGTLLLCRSAVAEQHVHVYVYIHINVWICVYVYISIYVYMFMCQCVYIYIYIHICVYMYIHIYVYMYICIHVCMYA